MNTLIYKTFLYYDIYDIIKVKNGEISSSPIPLFLFLC